MLKTEKDLVKLLRQVAVDKNNDFGVGDTYGLKLVAYSIEVEQWTVAKAAAHRLSYVAQQCIPAWGWGILRSKVEGSNGVSKNTGNVSGVSGRVYGRSFASRKSA